MGRLENFIPQLRKGVLTGAGSQLGLKPIGGESLELSKEQVAFVRQINGHLSLKEIFLFLNNKGEPVSIKRSLDLLATMADQKILANEEDYFRLNSRNDKPQLPTERERSYFSEERLIGLLQKTTLFLKCDRRAAVDIIAHSELVMATEGTQLLTQGTKSSEFYVLLSGEVGVFRGGECLAHLTGLSVFGESAAIFNQQRNADVIATQNSWLLKIQAQDLVDTKSPESFEVFKGLRSRLILNHTLAANPLFQKVPSDIMQFFISKCRIEKWGKEQVVIEQDESGGDFYFILKGSVSVIKNGMPVTSLSEGDYFGEVAAIFDLPRTATIISESPCTFLVLNQKPLYEVLCSHFRLAIDIEEVAEKRRQSQSNIFELFEQDSNLEQADEISEITQSAGLVVDDDFLEASQVHFDLDVLDYSNPEDVDFSNPFGKMSDEDDEAVS
jgi:CRP-like cAMP-binding protein